jgi:hypothetical protein
MLYSELDDQRLDLFRQSISLSIRTSGAIRQALKTAYRSLSSILEHSCHGICVSCKCQKCYLCVRNDV